VGTKSINGGIPSTVVPSSSQNDTETIMRIMRLDCAIKEGVGKFGGKFLRRALLSCRCATATPNG
jgi:hypothetical protein